MKRILLLLMSVLSFQVEAETSDYFPFIEEGKMWEVYDASDFCHYKKFWIEGDTIIDGRRCHKLYSYGLDTEAVDFFMPYSTGEQVGKNLRMAFLYEEGKKVYTMEKADNGSFISRLLYDFSLNEDGTAHCPSRWGSGDYKVADVSTVSVLGSERRKISFEQSKYYRVDWIEGIGGFYHLFVPIPDYLPRKDTLYYCGTDDKIYYQMEKLPSVGQLLVDGKRWTYFLGTVQYEYQLNGDTIVVMDEEQRRGLKLYKKQLGSGSCVQYVGMITADGLFYDTDNKTRRLYDFYNLKEGTTLDANGRTLTVTSVSTEVLAGYEYHVFNLTGQDGYHYKWIEGIGSFTDFLEDYPLENTDCRLSNCVDHRVVIYDKDNLNGIGVVVNGKSLKRKCFYDLSGRHISSFTALRKGVYIQDGKKVVQP